MPHHSVYGQQNAYGFIVYKLTGDMLERPTTMWTGRSSNR